MSFASKYITWVLFTIFGAAYIFREAAKYFYKTFLQKTVDLLLRCDIKTQENTPSGSYYMYNFDTINVMLNNI